jgi:hypothetical protein
MLIPKRKPRLLVPSGTVEPNTVFVKAILQRR